MDLAQGERVALVGENGAGKSTLMNVLYGLYRPDAGEVHVRGERVALKGPGDAIRLGVGMVHQHFMLVPPLTVAENVVLGREPRRFGLLDLDAACRQVDETCRRFGFQLDPRARIEDLSVGSQQKVEIVKALHRGAQVLILDEPTAVLTPQEADELFAVTRALSQQGHTIVFVSHKLREVLASAERVVVMRRGRKVAEARTDQTTADELAELMVGEDAARRMRKGPMASQNTSGAAAAPDARDAVALLTVSDLSAVRADGSPCLGAVSLEVRPGEIVGIAGVDGNGQRELVEVLTGLRPANAGSVALRGRSLLGLSPAAIRRAGVGHVPEDRLHRGMIGRMTVEENLSLGRHGQPPFARGPWIDFAGRRAHATSRVAAYDVRPPEPTLEMAALSGGNQQKVVLARELDAEPVLLVVVQPTRGLDVAAVASIHERLRAHRAAGRSVLLVSLDLDEVLALSDRIYVLFDGRVTGHATRGAFDEKQLGRWMLGTGAPHA